MLSLDARGTIIKIQKDLAYKSEVLKKFIDGPYKKEDTYVLNYSPDIINKLIDYLSDRYVFDFYLLDDIMDELIIEKKEIEYNNEMLINFDDIFNNIVKIHKLLDIDIETEIKRNKDSILRVILNGEDRCRIKIRLDDYLHCLSYLKGYHLQTFSKDFKQDLGDTIWYVHNENKESLSFYLFLDGMLFTYSKDIWYEYIFDNTDIKIFLKDNKNKEYDIIKRYPTFNTDYSNIIVRIKHNKN